jgi:hypothetical protein
MALTSLAHYHALTISAVRKWKDPATGELSKIPPAAEPITDGNKMHDSSLFQMIKDNIQSVIEFAKDVERPNVILNYLSEYYRVGLILYLLPCS